MKTGDGNFSQRITSEDVTEWIGRFGSIAAARGSVDHPQWGIEAYVKDRKAWTSPPCSICPLGRCGCRG